MYGMIVCCGEGCVLSKLFVERVCWVIVRCYIGFVIPYCYIGLDKLYLLFPDYPDVR